MSIEEMKWLQSALDNDPDNGVSLSEWELGFIEDLYNRGNDYKLSDKQRECLKRIWEKL